MQLAEKHRPRSWGELIAQPGLVKQIETLRRDGLAGKCFFFSGGSGQGKTSAARILANEVADDWAITEWGGPRAVTADVVRWVKDQCRFRPMGRGLCFILNEVHAVRADQVVDLLELTEAPALQPWVTWIFTTTKVGESKLFDDLDDAGPLLSRCYRLPLSQRDLTKPFAEHIVKVARSEGLLNGKGDDYYLKRAERLLKDRRNNLRAALMEVEAGYLTASDEPH